MCVHAYMYRYICVCFYVFVCVYLCLSNGRYSFDVGNMHVVMMLTELPCGAGSAQYEWLQADLATVNRSLTPWLVVTGHRPMYWVLAGKQKEKQKNWFFS